MRSMISYAKAAVERAMKVQEVVLRALARKISWWQAAEIIGISDRQMRRWRERYEQHGYDGLVDRRRGRPSQKRVPLEQVEHPLPKGRGSGPNQGNHQCRSGRSTPVTLALGKPEVATSSSWTGSGSFGPRSTAVHSGVPRTCS